MPTPPALDTFQIYLLVVNLSSLLIHAIHFARRRRAQDPGISPLALDLITAAGGGASTMLAILIWDRRTIKENAWHHTLALCSLVLWGVAACFAYVCPSQWQTFVSHLTKPQVTIAVPTELLNAITRVAPLPLGLITTPRFFLALHALALGLVTLAVYGFDKRRAINGGRRIPEAVLLGLAIAGGILGALLALPLFHHKIRSPEFAWGLPLILAAQLAVTVYLFNAGML